MISIFYDIPVLTIKKKVNILNILNKLINISINIGCNDII